MLKRNTASCASAGSRFAILRKTCESILPPWRGLGCRVTRVATGSASSGTASSPINCRPSSVVRRIRSRRAGNSTAERISMASCSTNASPVNSASTSAQIPAVRVPVPTGGEVSLVSEHPVLSPNHHMGSARGDGRWASGADVDLLRGRSRNRLHRPASTCSLLGASSADEQVAEIARLLDGSFGATGATRPMCAWHCSIPTVVLP